KEARGRSVDPDVQQAPNGRVVARVIYFVPLAAVSGLVEQIKAHGQVLKQAIVHKTDAPSGKLALARLDVALTNMDLLVPRDEGFWTHIRNGLAFSLQALAASAGWLVVGLLFVLPWLLVIWFVAWVARRLWGRASAEVAPAPLAASAGT